MAAERTTGVAARVAMVMAEGDKLVVGKAIPASTAQIASECQMAENYVRSTQRRIRAQLGWQAK